jgi:hypothetical protein
MSRHLVFSALRLKSFEIFDISSTFLLESAEAFASWVIIVGVVLCLSVHEKHMA